MRADSSRDDFADAFETAFGRFQVALLEACGREREWASKVGAGMRAGLEFAAAEPETAQLLTNEALARGSDGIERYQRLLAYLAEHLRAGREEQLAERPPEFIERALAGGIIMLVAQRVDQGRVEDLSTLTSEAIQFVLTPYVGVEEAKRISSEQSELT